MKIYMCTEVNKFNLFRRRIQSDSNNNLPPDGSSADSASEVYRTGCISTVTNVGGDKRRRTEYTDRQ